MSEKLYDELRLDAIKCRVGQWADISQELSSHFRDGDRELCNRLVMVCDACCDLLDLIAEREGQNV